MKENTNEFSDV